MFMSRDHKSRFSHLQRLAEESDIPNKDLYVSEEEMDTIQKVDAIIQDKPMAKELRAKSAMIVRSTESVESRLGQSRRYNKLRLNENLVIELSDLMTRNVVTMS